MSVLGRMSNQPGAAMPQPGSRPGADAQAAPPADGDQGQQIEAFLDQAYQIMYKDGQANPQLVEALRQTSDPNEAVEALSSATAAVVGRVAQAGVKSGRQLDGPGVVLPSTVRVIQDLGGMAEAEGVHDFSDDEMNTALMLSMEKMYKATESLGIWSHEEFQRGVQELMAANKSGKLDQMVAQYSPEGEAGVEQLKSQSVPGAQPQQGPA